MQKTGWTLAALAALVMATKAIAGPVQDEARRLDELRRSQYRQCTSPECRSTVQSRYNQAIALLRSDPQYYFSTVDRERQVEQTLDLKSDPDVRKRCLAEWPNDYRMAEFCIRKQLMAKRRLNL